MATSLTGRTLGIDAPASGRGAEIAAGLRGFVRRFTRNKGATVAAVILFGLIVVSIPAIGSRLAPFEPNKILAGPKLDGPNGVTYFGTDQLGRDVFSRTIYGGRLTLSSSLV